MLEKLHMPQFEIKMPPLGLLIDSAKISDDEYCFLFNQGFFLYNLKTKVSKSEKLKQQAISLSVYNEKIRIFCKTAEIIDYDLKTGKKNESTIEILKNQQISTISISKTNKYFMLETNKIIYLYDWSLNLMKKYPYHSFPGFSMKEIWNRGDTHYCLLDPEKNFCVHELSTDEIFYLTHEGFKIYSFHWDRKINTKIYLGKENCIEIFEVYKKELLDVIDGLTSPAELIDTHPDLGLIAYLENGKIITANMKRISNRNENFDKKLKTFTFNWIPNTYFLIIQDLLSREIYLLDLIENKIMEFKIKENKNFDSNCISSDYTVVFQFKASLILLDLNFAILERIKQIDAALIEFLTSPIDIPHLLDKIPEISEKVGGLFDNLKKYDKSIRAIEFILEMCDKNFRSIFPKFHEYFTHHPAEFQRKYADVKQKLLMQLQIEIESIKEFIAEKEKEKPKEKETQTAELFTIKKNMYLLQLLFHNLTKIVDKNAINANMPMFDLDDFIY